MPEAVIVDAIRTPIGRAVKGSLKDVRADDLAAVPLRALIERNLSFCASSLHSVRTAFHAIVAGEGEQYVAAGIEAVSRYPAQEPFTPHPSLDGRPGAIADVYLSMGETAENVAERYGVTREAQDAWAARSQQRAVAARESGHFAPEIVPVTFPDGTVVDADDGPRPGTTVERLAALEPRRTRRPARPEAARADHRFGGRRHAAGAHGIGPIPAIRALLQRARMTVDEIDIVEINEAFAAQVIPCRDELGLADEQLNPFGGAIALGHPFGMTGARILTTLLNGLDARRPLRDRVDVRRRRDGPGAARRADLGRRSSRHPEQPLGDDVALDLVRAGVDRGGPAGQEPVALRAARRRGPRDPPAAPRTPRAPCRSRSTARSSPSRAARSARPRSERTAVRRFIRRSCWQRTHSRT